MWSKSIFRGLSFYRINFRIIWTELKIVVFIVDSHEISSFLLKAVKKYSRLWSAAVMIGTLRNKQWSLSTFEKMTEKHWEMKFTWSLNVLSSFQILTTKCHLRSLDTMWCYMIDSSCNITLEISVFDYNYWHLIIIKIWHICSSPVGKLL